MIRRAIVLAAHGSSKEPMAVEFTRQLAHQLARVDTMPSVHAAFYLGEPRFCEVLDRIKADSVLVIPLMTSEGYFCDKVLPAELAKNRNYASTALRLTKPIGTDPAMAIAVKSRFLELVKKNNVIPSLTSLILVGHGTARSARSTQSTVRLAELVRRELPGVSVRAAFLDDEPSLEKVAAGVSTTNSIVVPFFIAPGPHATVDIPQRLGLAGEQSDPSTFRKSSRGIRFLCERPMGQWPSFVEMLASFVRRELDKVVQSDRDKKSSMSHCLSNQPCVESSS